MVALRDFAFLVPEKSEIRPSPSIDLVREMETLLGVRLPKSYLSLLHRCNGGYISQHLVKVEGIVPEELRPYTVDGVVSVGSIAGITPDRNDPLSIAGTPYLVKEWSLPNNIVLLDGDGHTWIALDYRQAKEDPPVALFLSGSNQHLNIAYNFEDFIEKLFPFEEMYDPEGIQTRRPNQAL